MQEAALPKEAIDQARRIQDANEVACMPQILFGSGLFSWFVEWKYCTQRVETYVSGSQGHWPGRQVPQLSPVLGTGPHTHLRAHATASSFANTYDSVCGLQQQPAPEQEAHR